MATVRLSFVGCGDAFGAGGRLNTSFLLRSESDALLIDCGASTVTGLKRLGVDSGSIGWVVLSHLHGDHFGGLPWLILDGQFAHRRQPLLIAGPAETETRFKEAFEVLYPGALGTERAFEVAVRELPSGVRCELGPAGVTTFPVIHTPATNPHALRIEFGGKVIAYSGDTEWTDALLEASADADLFICECQEYERRVPGHLNFLTLGKKLGQMSARRMILTHMGPEMLARVDELGVEAASDGLEVEV